MSEPLDIETCCEVMHDAYERAAVGAGWETQAASRKPWSDVPEANKVTMRAAVSALLDHLRAEVKGERAARAAALREAAEAIGGNDGPFKVTDTNAKLQAMYWLLDRIEATP